MKKLILVIFLIGILGLTACKPQKLFSVYEDDININVSCSDLCSRSNDIGASRGVDGQIENGLCVCYSGVLEEEEKNPIGLVEAKYKNKLLIDGVVYEFCLDDIWYVEINDTIEVIKERGWDCGKIKRW